jgi:hypothetical protein
MNERILKLVAEARQYAWENETHWSANAEREALFEQKFAELLIQQCIQAVKNVGGYNEDYHMNAIKKYFGVEE